MDYIYSTLQTKYIFPYSTKAIRISLRKKIIGITKTEYPQINRLSPNQTEGNENRFNNYYKEYFNKEKTNLPKLIAINESVDVLQNRNCTFTDPRYPKFFKNYISKIDNRKLCLNIIETLDDPDKMKYFYESNYHLFINEETNFGNQPLIDILIPKISLVVDNNQSHMKIHQYLLSTSDITLKLKGICLVIRDAEKNNSIKLHLPLSFIPFYYSISHHLFLFFISKIITIPSSENEIDILSISLDMNLVKSYITDILSENKVFSSDSILINNNSYNESKRSIKYTWLIKNKELELEIQPIMFELKSITQATNKDDGKKIIIRKAISKTLICYYIKTGYANWEKSALCYLSSFKLFRKNISYAYGRPMKSNKMIVIIDEQDDKSTKAKLKVDQQLSISNKNNTYNKGDLVCSHFSNNKSSFSFFMTLKQINYFFTFYSYKVSLQIDIFNTKQFNFDLSFEKMKYLYQLKSKHNIDDIIRKCIIVNKSAETVICSIELLKGIAFESMEKFFDSKDELSLLKSTLVVSLPRIEWEEMVDMYSTHVKEMKVQQYVLKDEIVKRLLNVDKNKWPEIFSHFQYDLGKEIEKSKIKTYHRIKTVRK